MKKKKICVITGTRAEYGLLYWLMKGLQQEPDMTLQVIATGAHLSPAFGMTADQIEADGFHIDRRVDMLLASDTSTAVAKSMGLGLIGFADAYEALQPDLVLMLGDRYELVPAAYAALVARVPIAHIHGGEITEGAFDDAIRHSLTKLAHFHFVGAEAYRRRVIQMGEHPDRVYLVGGMGVDTIKKTRLLSREALEESLGLHFKKRNLLVTFHPVTLDETSPAKQFRELLAALHERSDTQIIFTMPNADTGNSEISSLVQQFVKEHREHASAFTSLGSLRYLSTLQFVDGVVGNSSSGLAEAPTFKIGTVNIGDRQKGRLQAASVIDCAPERSSIARAIETIYSAEFRKTLEQAVNPYGEGCATEKILGVLREASLDAGTGKSFYDLLPEALV